MRAKQLQEKNAAIITLEKDVVALHDLIKPGQEFEAKSEILKQDIANLKEQLGNLQNPKGT